MHDMASPAYSLQYIRLPRVASFSVFADILYSLKVAKLRLLKCTNTIHGTIQAGMIVSHY